MAFGSSRRQIIYEYMSLYDRIGLAYDSTRRADPYITQRLLYHLGTTSGGRYLDVGCGTGNYTCALADAGLCMYGIDLSETMLASARQKSQRVVWQVGKAESLPFENGTFDGAICTLAIHHFPCLKSAFQEISRVLSGGRLVLLTATPRQMRGYWLNEYFPQAMEKSIKQMPSREQVEEALRSAGFTTIETEVYEIRHDLVDWFLYSGKHRPEMYLHPQIRKGISTFSVLADPAEVEMGCQRLARDIESGRIFETMISYHHLEGDYLFMVASKG